MLAHTAEVKDDLEGMIKKIGKDKVKILCSGPASEIEKVKPHMDGRLPIKFVELDAGSLLLNAFPKGCADTHITILPEFVVPAGKIGRIQGWIPQVLRCHQEWAWCCWRLVLRVRVAWGQCLRVRRSSKYAEASKCCSGS
eukprot:TRINITY_DN6627_c0_g1_i1.p1 TRINITY_DN6627_c0_g1~~TRINITY_DN6627_c0_g1_i1.p1  ORF type:complete len:140 (+),score=19.04 TRINITY_DN6627_c0_g1_i1:297-716(+)